MKRSVAKRRETNRSDLKLGAQGISDEERLKLSRPARRLLAAAIERELNELGTLAPNARRVAEQDLMETVHIAFQGIYEDDHLPLSGRRFAQYLTWVGCKTDAGKRALGGINSILKDGTN